MIPLLLALSLALDTTPWDACADGDGAACLQVAQGLPLEDGQPSKRAASFILRSCALGYNSGCQELIAALPERHERAQTEALVGACMEGAPAACSWLQQSIPADYSVKESRAYCEKQDCEVDVAAVMPGQWRLHTPLSGHHFGEYIGAWVASTERKATTYQTKEQAVWIEGRTRGIGIVSDWVTFEGSAEPRLWWNASTGQVSPSPSWCPEQALLCAPDTPRPTDLKWMLQALAQVPKGTQSTRVGDALWLSKREQKDYRSGEVFEAGDLRILRSGQPDQVLDIRGGVRVISEDWVLVEDRMQTYLLNPQGQLLHTLPFRGHFALSSDGSTLLLDEVFIDLATGEYSPNSATRCNELTWDAGGAYCMIDVGLLHHPHPAGQPVDFVPPGGWAAYGRVEIQVPQLLPAQRLILSDGNQWVALDATVSHFTLWVGPHVQSLKVQLVSEDMAPTPHAQTVLYSPPAPGETLTLSPQLVALDVKFPDCQAALQPRDRTNDHADWSALVPDCVVELPAMLVGADFAIEARDSVSGQWWSHRGTVPDTGGVDAQRLPQQERSASLDYRGVPGIYNSKAMTWLDEEQARTSVSDTRTVQVTGSQGVLVLHQGDHTLTHASNGNYRFLKLPPGTWTGAFITRHGSAPVTLGSQTPDTVWLPEVAPGPTHQVRVTDADGLPLANQRVQVALNGQEPTWSRLPKDPAVFTTDSAGRAQIPDPGWPIWAWGPGWMVQLEGAAQHTVQTGSSPAMQRGINARLTQTPYGLQVEAKICVEKHWLEKGDTLVQACGASLAGRSERALEELLLTSPTQSCPVQVLSENGTEKRGVLSAAASSPFSLPAEPFPKQPIYETPEYEAWREVMLEFAPAERCGPPLSSELLGGKLALQVLKPGDGALLVKDAQDIELDYVVWVPAGFPALTRLGGVQSPEEWPFSVPAGGTKQLRIPRGVVMAAKELGVGAQFRVWLPSSTERFWLVADVEIRALE